MVLEHVMVRLLAKTFILLSQSGIKTRISRPVVFNVPPACFAFIRECSR